MLNGCAMIKVADCLLFSATSTEHPFFSSFHTRGFNCFGPPCATVMNVLGIWDFWKAPSQTLGSRRHERRIAPDPARTPLRALCGTSFDTLLEPSSETLLGKMEMDAYTHKKDIEKRS